MTQGYLSCHVWSLFSGYHAMYRRAQSVLYDSTFNLHGASDICMSRAERRLLWSVLADADSAEAREVGLDVRAFSLPNVIGFGRRF